MLNFIDLNTLLRLPKAILFTIVCLLPFMVLLGGMVWLLITFEADWGRYFSSVLMIYILFLGFKFALSVFMAFVAFLLPNEQTSFRKVFEVTVIDPLKEIDPISMLIFAFIGVWLVFTSQRLVYFSDWIEEDVTELYGILMLYLGLYEALRITERKNDINRSTGYNEEDSEGTRPKYPLGLYLQSILVMVFWSSWMILLFYLFEEQVGLFDYKELVLIVLIVGLTYLQSLGLRKLERWLANKDIIQWYSGYGEGLI